jgi:hypothetical protein
MLLPQQIEATAMSDTAIAKLHELIEKMTNESAGKPITREALREAAVMLSLFPEHRFRKAFHETLDRLDRAGLITRDGDEIELQWTVAEVEAEKAKTRALHGAQPPADQTDAQCARFMELWKEFSPDNKPVTSADLREYCMRHGMPRGDVYEAEIALYRAKHSRALAYPCSCTRGAENECQFVRAAEFE